MKRNPVKSIAEIVFPILLMTLLLGIRNLFDIETYTIEKLEGNDTNYMQNKSIAYAVPDTIDKIPKWNGLNAIPIGFICKKRPLIAFVGKSFPTELVS